MRGEGMSTRAIGSALGMDESTARADLRGAGNPAPDQITGTDGKTYTPRVPEPEIVDAEIVGDEQGVDTIRTLGGGPARGRLGYAAFSVSSSSRTA